MPTFIIRRAIVAAVLILIGLHCAFAQEAKQAPKREVVPKTVTGVVSGISYNFIAVMYGHDAKGEVAREMAFNVDKNVRIEHKPGIKDIKAGDTVTVAYDEITVTAPDGSKAVQRITKAIAFLRQGQNRPEDVKNDTLASAGESADMSLSIKGIKKGD
jgi:hypothetical protein